MNSNIEGKDKNKDIEGKDRENGDEDEDEDEGSSEDQNNKDDRDEIHDPLTTEYLIGNDITDKMNKFGYTGLDQVLMDNDLKDNDALLDEDALEWKIEKKVD